MRQTSWLLLVIALVKCLSVDSLEGSFFNYMFSGSKDPADPESIPPDTGNTVQISDLPPTSTATAPTEIQTTTTIPGQNLRKPSLESTTIPPVIPAIPPPPQASQVVVPDSTTEIPEDMPPIDISYDAPIKTFFNNGTLEGWTSRHSEAKGTVS